MKKEEKQEIRAKMKGLADDTVLCLHNAYAIARDRRKFTHDNTGGDFFTPVMKDETFLKAASAIARECGLSRILVEELSEMANLCR